MKPRYSRRGYLTRAGVAVGGLGLAGCLGNADDSGESPDPTEEAAVTPEPTEQPTHEPTASPAEPSDSTPIHADYDTTEVRVTTPAGEPLGSVTAAIEAKQTIAMTANRIPAGDAGSSTRAATLMDKGFPGGNESAMATEASWEMLHGGMRNVTRPAGAGNGPRGKSLEPCPDPSYDGVASAAGVGMAAKIERIDVFLVDLPAKVARSDAIQSFTKQETIFVEVFTDDGASGLGYSYTIGTGGRAVCALIAADLAPKLVGRDPAFVEDIWKSLFFHTHATAVGAITSLALAAIDTALWDLRCRRANLPLHIMAGGARRSIPCYDTEGGWLQIDVDALVANARNAKSRGLKGFKVKIGRPHASEDIERLTAVREAVGADFEVMTDANQGFTVPEAIRRARLMEPLDVAWFEEPLPAEDLGGHVRLSQSTSLPIAIGESIYHPSHCREYLAAGACSVVQTEVARIGGITPWLKTAHIAESFNVPICPHFLMEIHLALCCAVPNAQWLEYIPQLDDVMAAPIRIEDGHAYASDAPGLGIAWDRDAIEARKTDIQAKVTA